MSEITSKEAVKIEIKAQITMLRHFSMRGMVFFTTVQGTSMYPVFRDGDILTVEPRERYAVGDIVVFIYNKTEILVHRLLEITDDYYRCKGDNCYRFEDVAYRDILGCAVSYERHGVTKRIELPSAELIELSYAVGLQMKRGVPIPIIRQSEIYTKLKRKYLNTEEENT